jgi:hypothetical protein
VAVGERERTGSTTFFRVLSRLLFVDWVTGGERQRGGEINRGFLVASKAPSGYSTFGLRWFWYERDLGAVGLTGVKECSLEAPSSSADVRVCKQNWVWFGGPNSVWNLVGLPGVWLAGGVPVHCGVDVEFRRAGLRGWLRFVCVRVFLVESVSWFIS